MSGCVTRGKGCIAKIEPCTSYNGNQFTCSLFLGNSKNVGIVVMPLLLNNVEVDTTANADDLSQEFQIECVTKGSRCTVATAKCKSDIGTQAECSKFKEKMELDNFNVRILVQLNLRLFVLIEFAHIIQVKQQIKNMMIFLKDKVVYLFNQFIFLRYNQIMFNVVMINHVRVQVQQVFYLVVLFNV